MEFAVGVAVAFAIVFFVLRNQVAKNEELQKYVDEQEVKFRATTDELWDDLAALKTKAAVSIAELQGKIGVK